MRIAPHAFLRSRDASLAVVAALVLAGSASGQCEPGLLGSVDTPGDCAHVAVSGTVAYVANYHYPQDDGGLTAIDVSDPANPAILGSVDLAYAAFAVAVSGTVAYVADGNGGLQVIDVSDPENPTIIGSVRTPNFAKGIAVSGTLAYVADSFMGLQVIDVLDPAHPTIIGSVGTLNSARGVAVSSGLAYVADNFAGLTVIDVSDPLSPAIMGSVDTPHQAQDVVVSGTMAYVADFDSGLQVIDISNPEHPAILGAVVTPGRALRVAVSGTVVYVADVDSGLQVIDVSDPANPTIIGSVVTPGLAYAFAVSGTLGYAADWSGGLQVIDVSSCGSGPPDNQAPTADAGADQAVDEGELVTLDGTGSGDPDADPIDFAWSQIAGQPVTLNLTDPAMRTFYAPGVGPEGEILTFQLVTSDGELGSEPDFVNVTVVNVNHPPVPDAGAVQIVDEFSPVTLDATASFDPDGEGLTFEWIQVYGDPVTLIDFDQPVARFDAPGVPSGSIELGFEVLVTDGIDFAFALTTVTVVNVNQPPVADAGSTQAVDEGTAVVLDGSGSTDPDGDGLFYDWVQVAGPSVSLDLGDPVHPTFIAPEVGVATEMLVFELVVDDGDLESDRVQVVISVRDVIAPPECDLGEARIVGNNGSPSRDNVMWPPNHRMHEIVIIGVADPNDSEVTIRIDRVTQDEPLNGDDDGNTDADAIVQENGALLLRAERSGAGDGRVYVIEFTAINADGGECSGAVTVVVPLSKRSSAVDSGQGVVSWQR